VAANRGSLDPVTTGGDVRERLLAAAEERLEIGGLAALQVADVARTAGVATGSVYRHFPSKSELVEAVFRRTMAPAIIELAVAMEPGPPALQRLGAGVERAVRQVAEAPRRFYALLAEPLDVAVEPLRHEFRSNYQLAFAQVLTEGRASGEVAPCDPDVLGAFIAGGIFETLFGALACRRALDPDLLVADLRAFAVSAADPRRASVHA
jgi:AcrR family transcriptional regulator